MSLLMIVLLTALLVGGFSVYQSLLQKIRGTGDHVRTEWFGLPDLLLTLLLTGFCTVLVALWLTAGPVNARVVEVKSVLPGVLPFLILMLVVLGFLQARKVALRDFFGFDRLSPGRVFLQGAGLLLAAVPLVFAAAGVTSLYITDPDPEQPLVKLFRELVRNGDMVGIVEVFVAAVIVAPCAEEILFRGYFYGVFKRYCGGFASAVFTAALFAAFHMNLASLPSLMVLALCLTIAYEATGCLLVSIAMHALFNFSQLFFLYWDATSHAGR